MRMNRIGRSYWLTAMLALACAESPVEPALVGTLTVQPPTAALDIGSTQQFWGVLVDSTGLAFAMPDSVHWLSFDTTVVTITWNGGLATARGPGVGRIQARFHDLRETIEVTVRPPVFGQR